MNIQNLWLIYLIPMLIIWLTFYTLKIRKGRRNFHLKKQAINAGLTEPASLHPVINPNRCIGCESCIQACPENQVLGLINSKAELIHPTHCIGHGACKTACPVDAITLVFGTEKRGVDIPHVKSNFETNVPGIFIAGELGGMGLIRNAITQGKQALEFVYQCVKGQTSAELDVVIVGAGPAGIAAALTAMENNLKFEILEQDSLGGTVAHFPRGKIVMTAPVTLPLIGKVKFTETSKEILLNFWQDVVNKTGLKISFNERIEKITKTNDAFRVESTKNTYLARTILLAIGRRGTPRKLGVSGEDMNKVVYRLIDAAQYRGQHVLVVGGGDSALEAAISIAEEPDTTVTISYRADAFSRAKEKNRHKLAAAETEYQLKVLLNSNVKQIHQDRVSIEQKDQLLEIQNDAVIICAGGILPTPFLKEIGIELETKYGTQ